MLVARRGCRVRPRRLRRRGQVDAKTVEKCLKDEQNLKFTSVGPVLDTASAPCSTINFAPGQQGVVYVFGSEDDAKKKESDIKTFQGSGGVEERNGNVVVVYSPEVPKAQQTSRRLHLGGGCQLALWRGGVSLAGANDGWAMLR